MRFFFLLLPAVFLTGGCKQSKENIIEKRVMDYIKNTNWQIVSFKKGATDVTADFRSYSFLFKDDKTVDALKNGTRETTGIWDGHVGSQSIYANFTTSTHPLPLLNGTWVISDGGPTFVVASALLNSEKRTMRMQKL